MNAAKEWANEIVNGRVDGNQEELLAVAASIDELVAELADANAELAKYAMTDPFKAYPSTVEDLIHLLGAYFVDILPMAKVELLEDEIEAWEKLARPMLAKVLDTRDAEIERLRAENEQLRKGE